MGVRWSHDFNFISLLISGVEHICMCLLAFCLSLEKCIVKSFARFKIRLMVWGNGVVIEVQEFFILDINSLSDISFTNIFSHFMGWFSTLLTISLAYYNLKHS